MNTYIKKVVSKIVSLVIAVAIMATALVGCGDNQTNESLTIYSRDNENKAFDLLSRSLYEFKSKKEFENVKIDIVDLSDMSDEEYNTKLSADMLSGNGPDIVMMDRSFFQQKDVYKMMDSGVFADIGELIKNDESYTKYDENKYNKTIMKAGKIDGKQYVIPLFYDMPLAMTTQEILERDEISTDYSYLTKNLINLFTEKVTDNIIPRNTDIFSLHEILGFDVVDYNNQQVKLNDDRIKDTVYIYKSMYNVEQAEQKDISDSYGRWYESNNNKKYTFELYGVANDGTNNSYTDVAFTTAIITDYKDYPVVIPISDKQGKIHCKVNMGVGIKRDSKSLITAYELIKIMLKDDKQEKFSDGIPVNNLSYGTEFRQHSLIEYEGDKAVAIYTKIENYTNEYGEEKSIKTYVDIDLIPQETYLKFFDEYSAINSKVLSAYFPTPISSKMYEYFIPYYKDEMSYEECLEQAKQQLQIYISE